MIDPYSPAFTFLVSVISTALQATQYRSRVGAIASPPHQTVRADLPHTAFRSSSPVYYQATVFGSTVRYKVQDLL